MSNNRYKKRDYKRIQIERDRLLDRFEHNLDFDPETNTLTKKSAFYKKHVLLAWGHYCKKMKITKDTQSELLDSVNMTIVLCETDLIISNKYNGESDVKAMTKLYTIGISPEDLAIKVLDKNVYN